MLRIVLFLVTLLILALAGQWIIEHNGTLTINWLGYQIDTTSSFATLMVGAAIALVTAVLLALTWLRHAPQRVSKHYTNKKRDRSLTALTQGFAAIAAEDPSAAKKHVQLAERGLGETPLTLLLHMQLSQLEGNDTDTKRYLSHMMDKKETKLIALKGLLLHAQKEGNIHEAIALAERAYQQSPKAKWIPPMLADLYARAKQWKKAQNMLETALKHKCMDTAKAQNDLGMASFFQAYEAMEQNDSKTAVAHAQRAHKYLPDFTPAITLLSQSLNAQGHRRKASRMLEQAWKTSPHPDILHAYRSIYSEDSAEKRLKRIESLTSPNTDHLESHSAIIQAALEAKSYSKARNHLKLALQKTENVTLCKNMADLEKCESASASIIQEWLDKAANAPQDAAWVCNSCNYNLPDVWKPDCPNCHAFNHFSWKEASKVHSLPISPEDEAA